MDPKLDQLSDNGSASEDDNRTSPADFVTFLPWACVQFQMNQSVIVQKMIQNDYVSVAHDRPKHKIKSRLKHSQFDTITSEQNAKSDEAVFLQDSNLIIITAVYSNEHLVQIRFEKNAFIPRLILQIIQLIIRFHAFVTTVTVIGNLDKYTIYELSKIVSLSQNITDICLDGTFVKEANYHLILDNPNQLRNLSLARCQINDKVVKAIADKLVYPAPASKVLCFLNLSSNKISDTGAAALARVFRCNKSLYYLNLANNRITDIGCNAILSTLVEFHLSVEEIVATRHSHLLYLKEKKDLTYRFLQEMVQEAGGKSSKSMKKDFSTTSKKSKAKDTVEKLAPKAAKDQTNELVDPSFYQRAEYLAQQNIGDFTHPFNKDNTTSKNGLLYSKGNNTLCYLNLAYNNLSYISLKKLITVIEYQVSAGRKPIGLIMVSIEGNPMPSSCDELKKLESHLQAGIAFEGKAVNKIKKRPISVNKLDVPR